MNDHMLCTGKVLSDKTGELKKLIQDARRYLVRTYPKQNKIQTELDKYDVWDMCDNPEEIFEANGKEFFIVFYVYLNELFEIYAKFSQFDSAPVHKLKRFLTDEGIQDANKSCS